ncbi:bleomycin resistance protein [Acuticoccus kandeliae]|uniref:bleomycin resistance protein n=1 Tax=Acuticoccus kandeliae TaxID=2073160 RepID=UPI000D3ED5DB|nr:VOC family protein [Acuticoccus kandeliae]
MLNSVAPILPARDFDKTVAFYRPLGFEVRGRFDGDGYLILKRDAVELHFFRYPDLDPGRSAHGAYVRVADPRALSDELAPLGLPAHGIPRFHPVEEKPWGMVELALIDEDGNLIRAGAPVGEGGDG